MTWSIRYDSVDALRTDVPAEPKPPLNAAAEQRLAAARDRAERAINSGLVAGSIGVTITENDAGVVSVSLTTRPNG